MSEKIEKKGIHYAFFVFIGCCCLCAGSYGSVLGTISVYVVPIITELGCGAGDLLMMMTFLSVVSFFAMSILGGWLKKYDVRIIGTVLGLILVLTICMFSLGTSPTWYWIWGAVLGFCLPATGALIPPLLINRWFDKRVAGKYVGIAAACTGLGAFVFAPFYTAVMGAIGWHMTYYVEAAISAVLILPFTIFVFRNSPADMGLEPYGADKFAQEKAEASPKAEATGMTRAEALRSFMFWIAVVIMFALSLVYGFNSNMVAMCTELVSGVMDDPAKIAMLGAWMVSAAQIGNIVFKIGFGVLADKIGASTTFIAYCVILLVAFILWILMPSMQVAMLFGAFCFGTLAALHNVGFPLITRALFGDKDYSSILGIIMGVNTLISGISSTIIGFIYQFLGSYEAALIMAVVVVAVSGVLFFTISGKVNKATSNKAA